MVQIDLNVEAQLEEGEKRGSEVVVGGSGRWPGDLGG